MAAPIFQLMMRIFAVVLAIVIVNALVQRLVVGEECILGQTIVAFAPPSQRLLLIVLVLILAAGSSLPPGNS